MGLSDLLKKKLRRLKYIWSLSVWDFVCDTMSDTHYLHQHEWWDLFLGNNCQAYSLWTFWPVISDYDSWWPSPAKWGLEDTSVVPLQSSSRSQHHQFHQQAWWIITKLKIQEKNCQDFYHHKAEEWQGQEKYLRIGWLRPNEPSVALFFQTVEQRLSALWNMSVSSHSYVFSVPRAQRTRLYISMCANDEQPCRTARDGSYNSPQLPKIY